MKIIINAKKRDKKEGLYSLRKSGFIPAVLYGHGIENINLSVPAKEFLSAYKEAGESTIVSLDIDGEDRAVIIHDVQMDYMKNLPNHIDFYQIKAGEKMTAEVSLLFEGEAPAVKNLGGILVKTMSKVEVEALPKDLPHNIKVDLSKLTEIDSVIHIFDLEVSSGVKFIAPANSVVASISQAREEEKEEVKEESSVADIKVEGEEKRKDKEKEKEGEKSEETKK